MRFVPAVGLLLASPVVWQAVTGQRPVADALLVWLLAMLLSLVGWWLWRAATTPAPPPLPVAAGRPPHGVERRRSDRGAA